MDTYNLSFPDVAIDAILATGYELKNAGYIFRGVASEQIGTPSEHSWVLAGEGETGHGFTSPIPKGYIGVCVFNGTSWNGKLVKCVSIDSTPTSGSGNAISSGGAYASISNLATFINEALDNLTFTDTTPSAFLGDYINMEVSTTAGGIERIMTFFTILSATASKAGLLSAADKQKLDAILNILRSLEIEDTTAYADLGDKIVESIKATIGGTEEIISTFQILVATASKAGLMSAADKAKLDRLNIVGYKYAGIATPSTTPLVVDAKIFYIAVQGGNYSNFGLTVPEGISILKNEGYGWAIENLVRIDDQPTDGSAGIARSGGTYAMISAEAAARESADATLSAAVVAEQNAIQEEKNAREHADGMMLHEIETFEQGVRDTVAEYKPIVIQGDVQNAPDEVDLTSTPDNLLKFKDNIYNPVLWSGMGRIYLRKNIIPDSENYPFDEFVSDVPVEGELDGEPDAVFWDRINTVFVCEKDGVYYDTWTACENYVPARQDVVYMYDGTPYVWDGNDFSVDEDVVPNLQNILTEDMMPYENTIYVIRWDYYLNGDVTLPDNCILEFDGGSINGEHTITGNNTHINWNGAVIFGSDIIIAGTWSCPVISTKMFLNLNYVNSLRNLQYLNNDDIETTVYIEEAAYSYPVQMPAQYDYGMLANSNTTYVINGIIKALDSSKAYQIFNIINVENVKLCGSGEIQGDWDDDENPTHTGVGGEWGMCISISGSTNVQISDITLKHAWGDGIDIGGASQCYNVFIDNVTIDHCGRNGISVDGLENFAIRNCKITNICRTAPMACIDFEPNTSSGLDVYVKNGVFENNILINDRCIEIATRGSQSVVDNLTIKGNYMNGHYRGVGIDPYASNIRIIDNYIYSETNTPDDDNVTNVRLVYDDDAILMTSTDRTPQKQFTNALVELSGNVIYGTCRIYSNNAVIANNKFKNTTTMTYTDIVLTPDGQSLMRVEEELSSPATVLGRVIMRGDNNTFTNNVVEGYVSVPVGSDNIYSNNTVAQYMEFPAAPSGCPSGLRNKLVGNIIDGSFTIDANRANFEIIGNTINSSERFFVNGNECLFEGNTALNATCASAGRGNSFVGNRLKHLQLAGTDQSATSNVVGSVQGSGIIKNNIIRCTDISRLGSGSIFEGNQIFYSTPVEGVTCLIEGRTAGDKPVIIRNNYFYIADSITEDVPVIVNRSSLFGATDVLFDGNRLNRPSIGVSAHGSATGKFIVSNMGGESGLYADAPTVNSAWKGYSYYAEDKGYPVYWNGSAWKDAAGNTPS